MDNTVSRLYNVRAWFRSRSKRFNIIAASVTGIIFLAMLILFLSVFAATANTSVDFSKITTALIDHPFSATISTYGSNNVDIAHDAAQRNTLGNLRLGYYRIPLKWNGGNIVSSAAGAGSSTTGDQWISSIKAFGGTPEIVIGGDSADNNFTPAGAANMVRHFNKSNNPAGPVNLWVIGNEPGMSIQSYCSLFNQTAIAMKAVDPAIKVAGPAWAFWDPGTLSSFLQCAGTNVDVLDWHDYAMGQGALDTATALSQTHTWGDNVRTAYNLIKQYVPSRAQGTANPIQVQNGEYNFSWQTGDGYNGWQGEDRFYTAVNTVWGASVAAHIAQAGGRGNEYADLNGALGLTFEKPDAAAHYNRPINSPMPIYYGLEMLTGGNLFPGFGNNIVQATTSLPNVEVYASNNTASSTKNDNIVMINKSSNATQTAIVNLAGFSGGTVDVWQTNANAPFSAPVKVKSLASVSGTLSYALPPYTVTTFVLYPGTTTPPPSPQPQYSCNALTVQQIANTVGHYRLTAQTTATNGAIIKDYVYKFGDGSATSTTQSPTITHVYTPGTYTASVTIDFLVNGSPATKSCQTSVKVTNTTPPPTGLLSIPARINVGGNQYKDPSGNVWSADVDYSGGNTDNQAAGHTIKGTTMSPLFQDERWGNFSYKLPIASGTYTVRLYFAEIYAGCLKAGCRVFDVTANGSPWLTNFDIAKKVGSYAADIETKTVTVTNNMLNLDFKGVTGSPQVAAIEVVSTTPPVAHGSFGPIIGTASKCVDDHWNVQANGNRIQLYGCNQTGAQKWSLSSSGAIMNQNNYCLEPRNGSTAARTPVVLERCNGSKAQQWKVDASTEAIINTQSGLCMDDQYSGTADGNLIWTYSCNRTGAQKWTITGSGSNA